MPSVTISVTDSWKSKIKSIPWVNWSEIAREEVMKKVIFENYIKRGSKNKLGCVTDDEWAFCEAIDWHPVDELPLKKSFIRKYYENKKDKHIKVGSVAELSKPNASSSKRSLRPQHYKEK